MASSRQEISKRKAALLEHVREMCGSSESQRNSAALSYRELSARFGLSIRTVNLELQTLVEEGLLFTIPRVGTFAARGAHLVQDCFMFVVDDPADFRQQVQLGFEDRIAELGGSSLFMSLEQALSLARQNELPPLRGIFGFSEYPQVFGAEWKLPAGHPFYGINRVVFSNDFEWTGEETKRSVIPKKTAENAADVLSFDNIDGGCQATQHLLQAGHENIAFIGMHAESLPIEEQLLRAWSIRREIGWRDTLLKAGRKPLCAIRPAAHAPVGKYQGLIRQAILEAMRTKAMTDSITAAVTANDGIAQCLFEVLQEQNVPMEQWPVVVSFDDLIGGNSKILTSLRLPWFELGQQAASLLWQRHTEPEAASQGQIRKELKMRLIPRLSCQPQWSRFTSATLRADSKVSRAGKGKAVLVP